MPKISEAIGYDVEVSAPNGPALRGYITARWADERQPDFNRWLANYVDVLADKITETQVSRYGYSPRGSAEACRILRDEAQRIRGSE